ncbi:beta-ketoacyl-[acyl-carrier-protein] synthase family protein [Streptomyces sp. NBC_00525]|uniref:beta-ketoacyl-[acyl-carrier-protein] synthase family protein n=1 Tax=Streptomyces sp. NBC_00525 TaxID=2903660 RepID=UPI002E806CD9|nr:beta-ketoacyl-[acyl-carrier-protein] synthase family protein [Streptomyces sp. NBC_00525]WUC97130.1 beta-ketoacyl-[acyl-carrier-protein] synthase family protein [Streptomyces sp. NBC_00525]
MTLPTDIAVTGLGLVTPAGIGVGPNWAAVRAARGTAAALDPALKGMPVELSCRVPGFDPDHLLGGGRARRLDRFVQFALVAAREALADAGLDPAGWDGARVGVVLGSAAGGIHTYEQQHEVLLGQKPQRVSPILLAMHLPNMLAGQVAIEFGATGPNLVVATACASGATAIATACDLLTLGRCDVVLAGGSEAMITPLAMSGFANMGALSRNDGRPEEASRPFDRARDGFVAGEGAGLLVLERTADARARRARVRARVLGHGTSADAHHITAPQPEGRGLEQAVRQALDGAGASPDDVSYVNAHGTSTPLNDLAEARTLHRVLPGGPFVSSTKGVTGHLLGAAGAIEAAYTVLTVEEGVIPPTANLTDQDPEIDINAVTVAKAHPVGLALSDSMGFGGQNAVLAIGAA